MNRNTKQRQLVYEIVMRHTDHPTAEEIFDEIHQIDPKISVGTVYRNLNILVELGLINHIKVPGANRFDFKLDNHYHIICNICGCVFDSPLKYNQESDEITEQTTGFKILKHRTVFEGICPNCLKKGGKK